MIKLRDVWRYPGSWLELFLSVWLWIYSLKIVRLAFLPVEFILKLIFVFLPCPWNPTAAVKNDLNIDLQTLVKQQFPLFAASFTIATILSLWAVGAITYWEDRFFRFDRIAQTSTYAFYNYMDDWANILLYLIVVPFYVGLGSVVWSLSWSFQYQTSLRVCVTTPNPQRVVDGTRPLFAQGIYQTIVWIFATVSFCIYFAIAYQSDVYKLLLERGVVLEGSTTNKKEPLLYWFLTDGQFGVTYNFAGYYYILLNFVLLLSIVLTVLFFLSSAFSVVYLTKYIRQDKYANFESLRKDLQQFTLAFVCAKWLFLTYIINTYIWRDSYLGAVANLDATIIAYSIIGSLLLPIPRIIVQASWYARERKQFINGILKERPDLKSLVPAGWMRLSLHAANFLIGLIFVDTLVDISSVLQNWNILTPVRLN